MRIVSEATMLKFILERGGAILAVTVRSRSYFFFLTAKKMGGGIAPITDPYPGIVEMCGYDVAKIAENWHRLSRAKALS